MPSKCDDVTIFPHPTPCDTASDEVIRGLIIGRRVFGRVRWIEVCQVNLDFRQNFLDFLAECPVLFAVVEDQTVNPDDICPETVGKSFGCVCLSVATALETSRRSV